MRILLIPIMICISFVLLHPKHSMAQQQSPPNRAEQLTPAVPSPPSPQIEFPDLQPLNVNSSKRNEVAPRVDRATIFPVPEVRLSFEPPTLPPSLFAAVPEDDEIKRLLKARIKALNSELLVYQDKIEKNAGELPQLLNLMDRVSKELADCSVELLDNNEHKLEALKSHLKFALLLEAVAGDRANAGGPPEAYFSALDNRLAVELMIARLKRSINAKPTPINTTK